jgi:hypothetical protein
MYWQSLSDVYSQRVIKHPLSEATVSIKFSDNEVHEFELQDIYARKVLGFAAVTENMVNELINQWAESGGWRAVAVKRVTEQINTILIDIFSDKMNDPAFIREIASEIKEITNYKKNNPSFSNFITSKGDNIFNLFNIPGIKLLNDRNFLSALVQVDLSEGKVNVGPGEVAITLFTEAKNPSDKKGDLIVEGIGEIEIKGYDGRIGKGRIENAVHRDIINKSIDVESIEQTQDALFNQIQSLKAAYAENRILEFKNIKETNKIFKVLDSIYKSSDLKDFQEKTNSKDFTRGESIKLINTLNSIQPKSPDDSMKGFVDAAKQIIELSYKIHGYKVGKDTTQFRTYFNTEVIDEDTKLKTIFKYIEEGELTNDIRALIAEYYSKIPVESLIGAITIANYQLEEKFNYIIFANTLPGVIESGSLPCKVIGPFANNYEGDLRLILENINNLAFSPNADRGGGFQVRYGGTAPAAPSSALPISSNSAPSEGERLNIAI